MLQCITHHVYIYVAITVTNFVTCKILFTGNLVSTIKGNEFRKRFYQFKNMYGTA